MANKSIDYTTIGIIAAGVGLITLYLMKRGKRKSGKTIRSSTKKPEKRSIESIEKRLEREYKDKYGKSTVTVNDADDTQDKKNELAKESGESTEKPIINSGKNSGATVGPRPKSLKRDANNNSKLSGDSPTDPIKL